MKSLSRAFHGSSETTRHFLSIAQIDAPVSDQGFATPDLGQALPSRCDLLLWDLRHTVRRWSRDAKGDGSARVLSNTASNRLTHHTRQANRAFEAALQRGTLVVVLMSDQPDFTLHTLQEPMPMSLLEALPGKPSVLGTLPVDGEITACGEPFAAFFDDTRTLFRPKWSLAGDTGMPIASVGTACVARFDRRHPGGVLLLPALKPDMSDAQNRILINALARLAVSLRHEHAPALLANELAVTPALQECRQQQQQIEAELHRLHVRGEAIAARRRQLELGWSVCAGEPTLALKNFAQACAGLGWQHERITVSQHAIVVNRANHRFMLVAITESEERDAEAAVAQARSVREQVAAELAIVDLPCLLVYLADNHLPPDDRPGPSFALKTACERQQLPLLTSDLVYHAWASDRLDTLVAKAMLQTFQQTKTTA